MMTVPAKDSVGVSAREGGGLLLEGPIRLSLFSPSGWVIAFLAKKAVRQDVALTQERYFSGV